ncbi:MAG: hypothetical protein ABSA26_14850 [Thermoguttaceae bacterium]|jgi:hypothetical protein
MSQSRAKSGWKQYILLAMFVIYLAVIITAGWKDCVDFYTKRPYMILVCIAVAVVGGLITNTLAKRWSSQLFISFYKQNLYAIALFLGTFVIQFLLILVFSSIIFIYGIVIELTDRTLYLLRIAEYLYYVEGALGVYLAIKFLFFVLNYSKRSNPQSPCPH